MTSEQANNWYSSVANVYTSEQRKNWYSTAADAYNRVRPRYPQQLINRAVELAKLPDDAIILEVGCGPGNATVAFADLGFSMICLEPNQEMCQLAQQNCIQYPKIKLVNISFEEWQLKARKFNAVLAATSFHWISPEIGYPKAAAALQDNGSLILLWNAIPIQPAYDIYQLLQEVYQTYAPSLAQYEARSTQEENLSRFGQTVIDSGLFKGLASEQLTWEATHSIDDYLTLLSTLSPYIRLEQHKREALFAGLTEVLARNCITSISVSYLSALQVAQRA
ncbi:class I SAM-dependent methyltransferase [Gloeocapsopsis dulcis]|uniref:SAM-dependent methyltransferase n=1 Tax=Gloeocapsopsis dulcis AAB1 = 1H9 TaxID=1433147 RepID=A0A6N8FYZ2_9CHRO|nr:class I SAM-dependent methyltransferase [Gloeocapsopsis dulcis]MUL37842.1 SAM-dependent methyltransferase [Gloeocapsopsis dulcis AAB1 = 1H9]WNN89804.1 class I SAM-dependent methyltransferase [Gloeocapsopsis dulcis]